MQVASEGPESKTPGLPSIKRSSKNTKIVSPNARKQDAAMLTGSRPFTLSSTKADAPPASREDRMGSVLQSVEEHGS